jgi:hypothetical protein
LIHTHKHERTYKDKECEREKEEKEKERKKGRLKTESTLKKLSTLRPPQSKKIKGCEGREKRRKKS